MSTWSLTRESLCCPVCQSAFGSSETSAGDVEQWPCTGCGHRFPVRFGIPDLRVPGAGDPYLTIDEDLRAAERLTRRAEQSDFTEVLASYYEANTRVPASQASRFIAGTLAARDRAGAVLHAWQDLSGTSPHGQRFIDVGCGTGPLTVAAGLAGYRTTGIDVGLRWLVLAAARARDAGAHLTPICAHAEHLPLADDTVDIVASEYLLENLVPVDPFLGEARRILGAGGHFWCTTANRYTPAPDPHLGVPFAGWWPAPVVRAWAQLRHVVPPVRHLLGPGALRTALLRHDLADVRIAPAPVSTAQRDSAPAPIRVAVDMYRRIGRVAAGRGVLTLLGPSLVATARRRSP